MWFNHDNLFAPMSRTGISRVIIYCWTCFTGNTTFNLLNQQIKRVVVFLYYIPINIKRLKLWDKSRERSVQISVDTRTLHFYSDAFARCHGMTFPSITSWEKCYALMQNLTPVTPKVILNAVNYHKWHRIFKAIIIMIL